MRGDNHLLALTTTTDEITGEVKPLFSFPVQVCKATEAQEAKFDNAAPSGADYSLRYIDEATGEVFDYGDRQRGVKVGDEFHAIDPDAIAAIDDATKTKTMIAEGQITLDDARARYGDRVEGVYYLQSPTKGGSPKAYRLTYEALKGIPKGRGKRDALAIVTRRTARSRQQLAYIYADTDRECLVMCKVAFAEAMRAPDAQVLAPQTAEVEQAQVDMARTLVEGLPSGADFLDNAEDEALPLRRDLIDKAVAGEAIAAPKQVADTAATDDLAAALEASLAKVA